MRPSLRSRLAELRARLARAKGGPQTAQERRASILASRPADARPPRAFFARYRIDEARVEGTRVLTLARRRGRARMRLVYLHGGAYVWEMSAAHWRIVGRLLERGDVEIAVPVYPLAPERTCVEVIDAVVRVYGAVAEQAGPPVAVAGDSAGGGLAVALAQVLRDAGTPQPAALVLLAPWLDATCADPAQAALERRDPMLSRAELRDLGALYAGELAPDDPRPSPLFGELHGLAPTLTLAGTHDVLYADALRLHARVVAAGGRSTLVVGRSMPHVWPSMRIPEAHAAIAEIVRFLGVERSDAG